MGDGPLSDVVGGIGEVVRLGAGNPSMRRAGDNLAYGLEVVTGLVRTALLPLAVVNARAQAYFADKFPDQLGEKLADVPPDQIVTPKPSVAGPAMQGLNFSHEEEDLRDLYLNLLATAMDGRIAASAHPAFAEIIAALSAAEVAALDVVLRGGRVLLAEIRVTNDGEEGWATVHRHLSPWTRNGLPDTDPMLPAYLDNWARLGLVELSYMNFATGETTYAWVAERPEYKEHEASLVDGQKLIFEKGVATVTEFGKAFSRAVRIGEQRRGA
ncbi:DUF4393 domain-containing protein [Microbacterium sp.]|uniref:DUF4393 domain-containing protein n=1 Tax=Microbacterium sp. TaxID=51671 RepID=UPI003C72D862